MGRGTANSVDSILYGHLGPRGEELVIEPEIEVLPDVQLAEKALSELSADSNNYSPPPGQALSHRIKELELSKRSRTAEQILQKLTFAFLTPRQTGFLASQSKNSNARYCRQCDHEFRLNEVFHWSGKEGHNCLSCLFEDDESAIEACSSEHGARLWLNKRYG